MAEIKSDFLQSDECGFRFASSSPVQPGFNISQLHDPGSAAFPSAGERDSNHSHPAYRHRPGTSENTFLEFPLVIAAVARFSRKRGLWLVIRVNHKKLPYADTHCTRTATDQVLTLPYFPSVLPAAFLSQAPAASKSPKNPPGSPFLFLPRSPGKASHRAVPRYV